MSFEGDLHGKSSQNGNWQGTGSSELHEQARATTWKYITLAAGIIIALILAISLLISVINNSGRNSNDRIYMPDVNTYTVPAPSTMPKNESVEANVDKLTARVFNDSLAYYSQRLFAGADATSTNGSYDNVTTYNPSYAIDGEVTTSWQEGVDGYGEGEMLFLEFYSAEEIEVLSFVMGSHTYANYYEENGKPCRLRIDFSDDSYIIYEFPEVSDRYSIKLSRPVVTSWVGITIISTYPGTKFEDTAIAEVAAYGER